MLFYVIFSCFKIPIPFRFCFFLHFPPKNGGPNTSRQVFWGGQCCPKEIPPDKAAPAGPVPVPAALAEFLGEEPSAAALRGAARPWATVADAESPPETPESGVKGRGSLGSSAFKKKKHREAAENRIRSFLSRDLWKDVLSSCDFVLPGAPWCFSIDSLRARRTFYSDSVFSFGSCQFLVFCMPADRQTLTIGHLHPHQKMPTRWM